MEVLEAAALKRAVRLGEPLGAPRVSDLGAVMASTVGKVELESVGDDAPEERVVERVNARLEEAAMTTARALGEVSRHWDAVYDAMRRPDRIDREISSERNHDAARARRGQSSDSPDVR